MKRRYLKLSWCLRAALVAWCLPYAYSEAREVIWVNNCNGDNVHIFDTSTLELYRTIVVGANPTSVATPADCRVIFLTLQRRSEPTGELLWIDPQSLSITHRLELGLRPDDVECTPDGKWVYVACDDGNSWIVGTRSRKTVKKIKSVGRPHNILMSADGALMYLGAVGPHRTVKAAYDAERQRRSARDGRSPMQSARIV